MGTFEFLEDGHRPKICIKCEMLIEKGEKAMRKSRRSSGEGRGSPENLGVSKSLRHRSTSKYYHLKCWNRLFH